MNHDVRYGNYGVLYAGGNSLTGNLAEHGHIKADFFENNAFRSGGAQKLGKAHNGAYGLAYYGGKRRARNPHFKRADKDKVEYNIHHRGENKVIKRGFAVAHRPQDSHAGIIH